MHRSYLVIFLTFCSFVAAPVKDDFSGLNSTTVQAILYPQSVTELQTIITTTKGPLSIAGGSYSQGGHTFIKDGTVIDIKFLNKILNVDPAKKTVTVQSGATWKDVQEAIDLHNLSLKVMQSYNDFTIGGSLSVNVHGRYLGHGPIIETVKEITVVTADGSLLTASRMIHPDLFAAAIGGYGAMGIIVEATLELTDNQKLERKQHLIPVITYPSYFTNIIKNNPTAILHNADLYPPDYTYLLCTTWHSTNKTVTCTDRLQNATYSPKNHVIMSVAKRMPTMQKIRTLKAALTVKMPLVLWRNYEAGYGVIDLFYPKLLSVSLLQEYFIPVAQLSHFLTMMRTILQANNVNVLNISLRHVKPNNESILSWSTNECFAVVLFYDQMRFASSLTTSDRWTQDLIDTALKLGGTYYLPYRLSATRAQCAQAYPRIPQFMAIKKKYDPQNRFSNTFIEKMLIA